MAFGFSDWSSVLDVLRPGKREREGDRKPLQCPHCFERAATSRLLPATDERTGKKVWRCTQCDHEIIDPDDIELAELEDICEDQFWD